MVNTLVSFFREIQVLFDELNEQCNEIGLEINFTKTKLNNQKEYQDTLVKKEDTTLERLQEWMKLAWSAFGRSSTIFSSRMPLHPNKKMFG